MIKVLIVDDHILIRKGIVLLLENYPNIEVVGEAGEGEEAIHLAEAMKPDIVLMDISIPHGLDGFTATQEIKKQLYDVKVILLTMHNEIVYIQKGIDVNADGYLLKNSQGSDLYDAIESVYNGKKYYNVGLPQEQIEKLFNQKGKEQKSVLTMREQTVLRLTVLGYSNIQMAEKLFISSSTVENHKSNIMHKLELKKKSELVQYGLANNFM